MEEIIHLMSNMLKMGYNIGAASHRRTRVKFPSARRVRPKRSLMMPLFRVALVTILVYCSYLFIGLPWRVDVYIGSSETNTFLNSHGIHVAKLDSLVKAFEPKPQQCQPGVACVPLPTAAPPVTATDPLAGPVVTVIPPPAAPLPTAPAPAKTAGKTKAKKKPAHKKPAKHHRRTKKIVPSRIPVGPVTGDSILAAAMRKFGRPYSWGGGNGLGATYGVGRGAYTVGFDCSGLTFYALVQTRIYPKTMSKNDAQHQWDDPKGKFVAGNNLAPGDLVFFGTKKKIRVNGKWTYKYSVHHVGIYNGAGNVVHAPHTGAVVTMTPLTKFDDFVGAKRFAPPGLRPIVR